MKIRACSSIDINCLKGSLACWQDKEMGYVGGISISLDEPHQLFLAIMETEGDAYHHHSSYPVNDWNEWSFQLRGHPPKL